MPKLPALIFLAGLVVYAASPVKVQTDSVWTIPTVVSLLHEGNADLDEFAPTTLERDHGLLVINGHTYSGFPLGPSLAALPLIGAFDLIVKVTAPIAEPFAVLRTASERWRSKFHAVGSIDLGFYDTIELIVASLFVAGAAVLVFLTGRRAVSPQAALLVTGVFMFGTSAYSTASRVLWQHSPSILAVAAVVCLLTLPKQTWRTAGALGLIAALAFTFRPTNAITIAACAAWLGVYHRRLLLPFAAGGMLIAVPFCAYNLAVFDAVLPPYFLPERLAPGAGHFAEALAGNLVSPGRGLFIYSPVLLLCFFTRAQPFFVAVIAVHWVAISAFPHWWAGHSFGPRLFTDVLPYFAFVLFKPVEQVLAGKRPVRLALLGLAIAVSLFIHTRGATSLATHAWNDGPVNVDQAPERVWDWTDLAFLRGLSAAK